MILGLFFFFITSFSALGNQNTELSKHIERLSKDKVIGGNESNFVDDKAPLTKGEFLKYISNLLDSLKESKVSLNDFRAVESILSDIGKHLGDFDSKIKEHSKTMESIEAEHRNRMEELNKSLEKVEELELKVEELNKKVNEYFSFEEHGLRSFLRDWNLKGEGQLFSNLLVVDGGFDGRLNLHISKGESYMHIFYLGGDSFAKYMESKLYFNENLHFRVYSPGWREILISSLGEKFYDTCGANHKNESTGLGIGLDNFNVILGMNKKGFDIGALGEYKILNFAFGSALEDSGENYNFILQYLELGLSISIKDFAECGFGYLSKDKEHFGQIYGKYTLSKMDLKLVFISNLDQRVLRGTAKYFWGDTELGLNGEFRPGVEDVSFEEKIEQWELFFRFKGKKDQISGVSLYKDRESGDKNLIFKINSGFKRIQFKLGGLVSNSSNSYGEYRGLLFSKISFEIFEGVSIFMEYAKSNFKYHNDLLNFEGGEYDVLFSHPQASIEGSNCSVGFTLDI